MTKQEMGRSYETRLSSRVTSQGPQDQERERLLRMAESRPDLITLARGDPDLPTPPHIVEAAKRALDDGETHYTNWQGREDLRAAICDKYRWEYGVSAHPQQVAVTSGAQEALYITFQTLLNPGDEVLLADPHYHSYSRAIKLAGGTPVLIPTDEKHAFVLQPASVEQHITSRTKILVVVSPNNPTGAVIPEETLAQLADLARRHDLLVISDEIYEKWVFDGRKQHTVAALSDMADRTVIINGFSKTYAMTGWRVGYLIGPAPLVAAMEIIKHTASICAPAISQAAALAALTGPQGVIDEMHRVYAERRFVLREGLNAMGLTSNASPGGLYLFAAIGSVPLSGYEFCANMLDVGVQMFPWSAFSATEGYLRASFLQPVERLSLAIERMRPVVSHLRNRGSTSVRSE